MSRVPELYAYDGNGNTLSQTTTPSGGGTQLTSYTWDLDNRLRQVSLPSGISDFFAYDAKGLRIQKVDSTGTTNYLLDGPSVVEELDVNSNIVTGYLTNPQAIDQIVSLSRGGATYYPLTDALGSVYAVTDSGGALVAGWSYDVYGTRTQTNGSLTLNFGYTGREHDTDTGLIYNRQRYRDLSGGAWSSADRLGMQVNLSYYNYVKNSPTSATDPLGLFSIFQFSGLCAGPDFESQAEDATIKLYQIMGSNPTVTWFNENGSQGGEIQLGELAEAALSLGTDEAIPVTFGPTDNPRACAQALLGEITIDPASAATACADNPTSLWLAARLVHESIHLGYEELGEAGVVEKGYLFHAGNVSSMDFEDRQEIAAYFAEYWAYGYNLHHYMWICR